MWNAIRHSCSLVVGPIHLGLCVQATIDLEERVMKLESQLSTLAKQAGAGIQ